MTRNGAPRTAGADNAADDDTHAWLEDVNGARVQGWAEFHDVYARNQLSGRRFEEMRDQALAIFDADTRILGVTRAGDYLYNFWRDAGHPRGVWRRPTLAQYRTATPDWDVIIDLDALAAAEDENWVWGGGGVGLPRCARALIHLSRGGGDATVVREFDMQAREFVLGGFTMPQGRHVIDLQTLLDSSAASPTS